MYQYEILFSCILVIIVLLAIALFVIGSSKNKTKENKTIQENKPDPINTEPKPEPAHPLASRYETEFGGGVIPPGMKECYQCKTMIRADALTCPQCGKDPSKMVAIGDAITKIGMIPIYLIILAVSGCCLWSIVSAWLGS